MLIKTRGIIFRALKYSETSFITDIYTEKKGLQTYIVSGVRKKKALVPPSLLQLMTLVEMVAYHRDDKAMSRIKEIKSAKVYQSIPFDIKKSAIGMFMVEVARKTISESEENPTLFQFFFDTFSWLDSSDYPVANIHLIFLVQLSVFLGFAPGGIYKETTPFFDLQEGFFVPQPPGHTWFLNEEESQIFALLLQADYPQAHLLKITLEQRQKLLSQLLLFYKLHIENFPEINTHQILQEVLGSKN